MILNGDAGKKIENQIQPNIKRARSSINNKTLPEGNGPPPNFFLLQNEAGNRTPQLTARVTGGGTVLQGTVTPRQSQGQLTPPLRDPATHRAYTGRQHTPDMGATRNEVRLKRQAFESLFLKNHLKVARDITAPPPTREARGPGNDAPGQHQPNLGARGNEVKKIRNAFELLNNTNNLRD